MATYYATDGTVGVDLNNTQTTAQHSLLKSCAGSSDSMWVYFQANGAISSGELVQINTTGTGTRATNAGAATATNRLAFAQTAFADTEFGWGAEKGRALLIAVSATAANLTQLYVATTSGKLSTTAASGSLTNIQIANVSSTATTTTTTGDVSWPKCITPGF